jgi:malate synthase
MRAKLLLGAILGILFVGCVRVSSGQGFEQEDRERLIRLEATLQVFMQQTDKRFAELREDMNKRFEEMREDTNKRFEQVDKRFEQIDKRIDQLITFLWILAGIFTALVVAVIAFAYWDRRTIIRRAKEEALKEMEEAGRWKTILEALRQVAMKDSNVAEALKRFNLL